METTRPDDCAKPISAQDIEARIEAERLKKDARNARDRARRAALRAKLEQATQTTVQSSTPTNTKKETMETNTHSQLDKQTQDAVALGLGNSLAGLADQVVKHATQAAQKHLQALTDATHAKLHELETNTSVLRVQINNNAALKLKQEASPYLPRLITNAKLGLYTMLIGPAGAGKTTMASQVAEALALPFSAVCLSAGASETWLFGRQTPQGFVEGSFSRLYREGGVFLADEIDAADANMLLSINTALSHHEMFNPISGDTIKRNANFVFIGAANTNGKGASHTYTGRSRLDAATLDRFVAIEIDYNKKLEKQLAQEPALYKFLQDLRNKLQKENLSEIISTRCFLFSAKQLLAGVKFQDILDSITLSWSDRAKEIARTLIKENDHKQLLSFRVGTENQTASSAGVPTETNSIDSGTSGDTDIKQNIKQFLAERKQADNGLPF